MKFLRCLPLAVLALCGCASSPQLRADVESVRMQPDVDLRGDAVVVCVYLRAGRKLHCMTPEEFMIRFGPDA